MYRASKFDPKELGLSVPQSELDNLLRKVKSTFDDNFNDKTNGEGDHSKVQGIGLDTSITPLSQKNLYMIQSTDFFYPLINDPFLMGKIACANVLSDVYATGVQRIDNLQMILTLSIDMNKEQRSKIIPLLIDGFIEQTKCAKTVVSGGQTVNNPWITIGGTVTSICDESEFIRPINSTPGNVLVLTKPLGTQVAVNAYQWMMETKMENEQNEIFIDFFNKISPIITNEQIVELYDKAANQMASLNDIGAQLMHKYCANAATDITGFGLLGHAKNLVAEQNKSVNFKFHTMPFLEHSLAVDKVLGGMFKLENFLSAETSGGLLISLPNISTAKDFIDDYLKIKGYPAWIVADVVEGNRNVEFSSNIKFIEC
ncbi:hypothetical protein SNEBB_003620 [Seison nebaliae]|nr:hypothetical protein SNEBB_003620 [Seison nebaliae]